MTERFKNIRATYKSVKETIMSRSLTERLITSCVSRCIPDAYPDAYPDVAIAFTWRAYRRTPLYYVSIMHVSLLNHFFQVLGTSKKPPILMGNHLSNTTCLTHVLFRSVESCSSDHVYVKGTSAHAYLDSCTLLNS